MVQDAIKIGHLDLLNLPSHLVLDSYAADSKNIPLGIINDQSEHESLEDIELNGKRDYQNVIAMKLWTKQVTLKAMIMPYETFLELIASFSHVERLSLYHVFFEPTVSNICVCNLHLCTRVYTRTCTHTHARTHARTHTHTHTHIHTHSYVYSYILCQHSWMDYVHFFLSLQI